MALSFHHWDLQGDGTGLSDSPPSSLPTWHSASAPWPPCRSSEVAGSLLTWNASHPHGSPPSFFTSSLRSPGVFPGWPTANMCALCYPSCSCFILALVLLKHALRCYPCSSLFSLSPSQILSSTRTDALSASLVAFALPTPRSCQGCLAHSWSPKDKFVEGLNSLPRS